MRVSNEKVSEIFILNDEKISLKIPGLDVPARNRSKESASMSINYGTFNFQPLNSIEGTQGSLSPRMALLSPAEPQRKSLGAQQ